MAEAGFTVIRVGESVWSTWEPEDGVFDLDWLEPGARRRPRARHRRHPRHPDLRHPDVADAAATRRSPARRRPAPRSAGAPARRSTSPTRRTASTPSGSSAQVVGRHARPPGGHRLPGRQRARPAPAPQPRRLPAVHRLAAPPLRDGRAAQRGVGARLLVAPALPVGRPVAAGRQRPAAVRPGLASLPGRAGHRVHRLAGRHRPRGHRRPRQFVTTCISYEQPGVDDVELCRAGLDVASGNAYYEMAGLARAPERPPTLDRPDGLGRPRPLGACATSPTSCTPRSRRRSWSPRPTPARSGSPR